ncbi:NADH-quinone oxidoreductase subunit L [Nitrospira moscoviensis]|uniref:Putative NADH-quinone oxidoreductase, subunit L n=1 Tax=Nitrospira moscoviensis TaxID=42253 RepID=A0A0K2GFQ2_NITMO|nr:proton-conducting transporter membrane subunit [Nitrospira moscoviensis]ALA59412.1 putative NADH-quinone oxidoreductase, subunit L [Nitrospira moscoviensis]
MSLPIWILAPLLPLVAGVLIGLLGTRLRDQSYKIGVPAVAGAFAVAIWALFNVGRQEAPLSSLFWSLPLPASPWFRFGLQLDRLSAVMMVLITGVSLTIHLYSRNYMQGDRGYARFYALLGLITAVLLFLVTSANLFLLFVCWQLVSWLLYLLLVHNYGYGPAVKSAMKTWIILRLGDVAFLSGVVLAYHTYGTLELSELFERAAQHAAVVSLWPQGPEIDAVTAVTLLLFVGAMSKSAQFPLHVWLPDTMDTPTPVSALMHAGIVNAGGFLFNRLAPLFGQALDTLHVAFVIGGLTAIVGATIMLTQPDVKKMLGFSTMGQMGYMTMECGLGAFALAIFHLVAHGIFKATLFLHAGNIVHQARREPKFPPGFEREDVDVHPHLPWLTGVAVTLVLPLAILLAAHGLLHIPLQSQQGAIVFLFFAWVTSSQAILSLYRLRAVGSWKVAGLMVIAIALVVATYLWAAEAFTHFLYPSPGEAARYFEVAAFPLWLFDLFVMTVTLFVVMGWVVVYTNIKGQRSFMPGWIAGLMPRLYVWFWNRLFIDALYERIVQAMARWAFRVNAKLPEWLP